MHELLEIILLTLIVCTVSTISGALLGIPAGIILGMRGGRLWNTLRMLCTALVGIPPVLAGLAVYMMLRNGGMLSGMRLLFSPAAIVLAQIIIILPTIAASVFPAVRQKSAEISESLAGLNIRGLRRFFILLREYRPALITAILSGFGRAISEVGAVMLVGGNILHKTRVMTTAIVLETSKGNYAGAFILGAVLLLLSLAVNFITRKLAEDDIV